LIIIENEYTGEYAGRFNPDLLFITGPIDTEHYFMRSEKKGRNEVVIGWIGHPEHRGYILALTHIFKSLCKKYPEIRIMTIGAGDITMEGVNLITKNWSLETEIDNLHQFDIGIMPLPDDDVARGKGGYKLLQYMALGIPCVASPVGINSTMVKEGENGFLARTDNEWLEKISLLIEDKELRHKMGTIGRKIAVEEYSFSVAAPKLIRALRDVIGKR
jgi:glycosyltransferase involved in cell wall biosynthesis